MLSRTRWALLLVGLSVVGAAQGCGGEVRYFEDGDDGAGLSGSSGGSSGGIRAACEDLCSLECAGGGDPSCVSQCASAAPPGCEAELGAFLACAVEDLEAIDPVTCEGLGLCVGEATELARCTCEVEGGPCPF